MKTIDLLAKISLCTKELRPQGLQFALNLIESWSNQIQLKLARKEVLEPGDLWCWRILCPEDFKAFLSAYPNSFERGSLEEYEFQLRICAWTWESPERLVHVVKYIHDNWNHNFRQFYGLPAD